MYYKYKRAVLVLFFAALAPNSSFAGFFDDLGTAIGGHIDDLQSRFTDDQVIEGRILATASFRDNDRGQDALHRGSGSVILIETESAHYIQLGTDFTSTPGPDYHVYISTDTAIDHEERFNKGNQIELGRLVKGSGGSYYKLPENHEFQSVTIWCKAFDEFITSTDFDAPIDR